MVCPTPLPGRCKEDHIRSRLIKSFIMKACGDHSAILSPKNATPRRLMSDEPDLVSIPKAAEVCQFVTLSGRSYGKMGVSLGTQERMKAPGVS
jgi:hypothetical protein